MTTTNLPAELSESLRKQELVFFIGAGLSVGAGLPGWSALVRPWAEAVGARWPQHESDLTASHLLAVAQFYENQRGRNTLIRALRTALKTTTVKPTSVHHLLATLPSMVNFTTNYDNLLEDALEASGQSINVIVTEPELAFWSETQAQIVKLCGDLRRPDSIVITQHDFNTFLTTHARLVERLRTTLESKTALFLGYSLQDPFLNQIWDSIGLNFGALRRWGYAVLFDADPLAVEDFRRRGIQVIQLDSGKYNRTECLTEWLHALVSQAPPQSQASNAYYAQHENFHVTQASTKQVGRPTKILFLAANPQDTPALRIDAEIRAIDQAMRQTQFRDQFELEQHWAVRVDDLQEYLLRYQPDIVHFSGHANTSSEIVLEDQAGFSHPLAVDTLANLFAILKDNVKCVVLNACYSERQAQAIAKHIDCVLGMSNSITDKAAINFATSFYRALGYGRTIQTAFDLGTSQINLAGLSEQDIPQLLALNSSPNEIVFVHK